LTKIALVDEYGAYLHVKDGRFRLKVDNNVKWEVSPIELDSIVFTVDGASISASSIILAASYGIDLVFMKGSKPIARLLPAKYGSTMLTWLDQLRKAYDEHEASRLASLFIDGKTHNQRMVIYEYAHKARASGKRVAELDNAVEQLKALQSSLDKCTSVKEVLNVEAHAANTYWKAVSLIIPKHIGFEHRLTKQRIASGIEPDPFNIALNIGYAILRKEVWRAVFLAGLNPYVGFLHKERSGRMSLVFDLMEEFRAYCVDRPLIALARQNPDIILNVKDNTKEVFKAVINRMRESEDMVSIIVNQARLLAKHVRGTDTYKPFKSRW
jgi:CRISPR-associated protein Cas1